MPKFSRASQQILATCHSDIRKVCEELVKTFDVKVICGHRNKTDQEKAFKAGNSKVHYPNSAHNKLPSHAVDLVPYPVDWNDIGRFKEMGAAFMALANMMRELGIIKHEFVWGGTWRTFKDYPHFELKEK